MTVPRGNNRRGVLRPPSSLPGANSAIRPVDFETHPVLLRTYICPTMQVEELAERVAGWINAGVQQAVVFGPPGAGKTYGIRYVTERLSAQFADVGFVDIRAGAIGDTHGRDRLFAEQHVMNLIEETGQRSVVLWIDESQLLDPATEISLRHVQDRLKGNEIGSLTVLVGHPRVRVLKQKRAANASDFPTFAPNVPTEEFEFHGLRSVTEIEHCLKAFDNDRFPRGSDWSYTRFFLPQAYVNGLRLAPHAGDLWQEFVEADRAGGADTRTEVPMSYFAKTVQQALTEGAARDCGNMTIDRELWRRAVQQSGWGGKQDLRHLAGASHVANAIC